MKKIALFGTYPPPYGGRSIHVKRLAKKLTDQNIDVHVYSNTGDLIKTSKLQLRKTKSILFYILKDRYDIVHFHDRNFKLIFIVIVLSKLLNLKFKTVLTYHSFRDDPANYGLIEGVLFKYCIRNIDQYICVGLKEKEKLSKFVSSNNIRLLTSYIHPHEDRYDFLKLPESVRLFIEKSDFLISANGNIKFYNQEDLYGIDMLIELMNELTKKKYNAHLLIALLGVNDHSKEEQKYYLSLKDRIVSYKLEKKIMIFEVENTELFPILKRSNLFVRPTNTDSFGISVAEAIYAKIPAIASDVCERPSGTLIFESRNMLELLQVTEKVIKKLNTNTTSVDIENYDGFYDLYKIYESLT